VWGRIRQPIVSGFHRASLLTVTFINQLMYSIITIADVNICVIQNSKRHTLKNTPTCFGSHRIHHQGVITCTSLKLLIMVQLCLLCAWSLFGGIICLQIPTTHIISTIDPLYVISIKYRLSLPDDGSYVIRNMLEYF